MQERWYQLGDYVVTDKLLGKGSFGEVFLGYQNASQQMLAVKIIKTREFKTPIKIMKAQVELLRKVQSHNIVKLYDVKKNKDDVYHIFLEYCQSDLKREIQKKLREGQYISEGDVIDIFKQICNGYKILYQNKIIHRDIKPENILMQQGVYKIADFGFGRLVDNMDEISVKTMLGSPIYTAPQILQKKGYSAKCDIWSLGILLYQLLYYKTPFDIKATQQLREIVPKKKIVIPTVPQRSSSLCLLLSQMLKIEESERIDWPQLFTHQIFMSSEQLDEDHMTATNTVQKVLRFYKQLSSLINKVTNYFSYFQDQLPQKVYLIGVLALASYTLYLSKTATNYFFSKSFPHPSVNSETWELYKQTNSYWLLLQQFKRNLSMFEQFMVDIRENVLMEMNYFNAQIKSQVEKLMTSLFDYNNYSTVMDWVSYEIKKEGLSGVITKYWDICKNPLIYFSIQTDFTEVNEGVERQFNMICG